MASLRRLFEQYADHACTIDAEGLSWRSFERACAAHGLSSPAFEGVLASVRARAVAQARRATFDDICTTAAALCPEASVDKTLQDLRMDASALHRYVAFVRSHFRAGSFERRKLEAGSEDLAESFRGTLLHLLRLAAREAEAVDLLERNALLSNPVEQVLRGAAGRGAHLASPSLAPAPYDFQRAHAHAAAVRLAACAVKSNALHLQQRLYAPAATLAAAAHAATSGGGGGAPPPPALAQAAPAVLYATRAGTSYEECAAAAVPYELEVVRLPLLPSLDAIASSSISSAAYSALCAAVRGLGGDGGEGEGEEGGGSEGDSAGDGESAAASLGFHAAATALASGALTLPAPSANAALLPRASLTSAGRLHAEYIAASELVLSPYFADPCGILEGSEEDSGRDCASVLGLPTLFCYEYIPDLLPLSQLLEFCGPLAEGRPLFRHLAREVLLALCDIEAQCTLTLPSPPSTAPPAAYPITLHHLYLSECGARVSVRGVAWGAPLPSDALRGPGAARSRSRTLARCYGAVLRALLPSEAASQGYERALEGEARGGGAWEGARGARQAAAAAAARGGGGAVGAAAAEAGLAVFAGQTVGLALGGLPSGASSASSASSASASSSAAALGATLGATAALASLSPSAKHRSAAASALRLQPQSLEALPIAPLRSSSPVKRAGAGAGGGGGAAGALQQLQMHDAVWLPPILQLPGRALGDGNAAGGFGSGGMAHIGLPSDDAGSSSSSSSSSGSGLSSLVAVHAAGGGRAEPVPCGAPAAPGGDFIVTGQLEGSGVLWFFAVPRAEAAACAAAAAAAAAAAPSPGDGSARASASDAFPLLRPPPRPSAILAEVRVPFSVFPSKPSPTLSAILASNDPRLEQSPALATVRLLVSLCAAPRVAAGVSAEAAFVAAARELSAVLQFNVAAGAGGLTGGGEGEEEEAVGVGAGGRTGGGEGEEAAAVAAGAGGGGAGAAGDALAALVAALEEGDEGADEGGAGAGAGGGGGAGAGGEEDWTPLPPLSGGAEEDGEGGGGGAGGGGGGKKSVRWLCHLARHSYFAEDSGEGGSVADDYAAWAFPLRELQSRKA